MKPIIPPRRASLRRRCKQRRAQRRGFSRRHALFMGITFGWSGEDATDIDSQDCHG